MTRWAPFFHQTLNDFNTTMNRLFQEFQPATAGPGLAATFPPVNLWEDEENLYAEAELPGLSADDLAVHVQEGNQLVIEGERKAGDLPGTWHRRERGTGKFRRTVALPAAVDPEKVEGRFEQGVLWVKLPRSAAAKPRRIPVKAE